MGKLIVIEGLDGSGKATQTGLLCQALEREGKEPRRITFPDYDSPSSALVKMYLSGELGGVDEVGAYGASLFYTVDRYASYLKNWKRDYQAGGLIDQFQTGSSCPVNGLQHTISGITGIPAVCYESKNEVRHSMEKPQTYFEIPTLPHCSFLQGALSM